MFCRSHFLRLAGSPDALSGGEDYTELDTTNLLNEPFEPSSQRDGSLSREKDAPGGGGSGEASLVKRQSAEGDYAVVQSVESPGGEDALDTPSPASGDVSSTTEGVPTEKIMRIARKIAVPAFSVFFIFVVTIAIFPSLIQHTVSMSQCSSSNRLYNDLFVPFMFLLFNLFDLAGRIAVGFTARPLFNANNVWIPSGARMVFFP